MPIFCWMSIACISGSNSPLTCESCNWSWQWSSSTLQIWSLAGLNTRHGQVRLQSSSDSCLWTVCWCLPWLTRTLIGIWRRKCWGFRNRRRGRLWGESEFCCIFRKRNIASTSRMLSWILEIVTSYYFLLSLLCLPHLDLLWRCSQWFHELVSEAYFRW